MTDEYAKLKSMNNWIDFTTNKPTESDYYLCVVMVDHQAGNPSPWQKVLYFDMEHYWLIDKPSPYQHWTDFRLGIHWCMVTHWMQLPAFPKQKSEPLE